MTDFSEPLRNPDGPGASNRGSTERRPAIRTPAVLSDRGSHRPHNRLSHSSQGAAATARAAAPVSPKSPSGRRGATTLRSDADGSLGRNRSRRGNRALRAGRRRLRRRHRQRALARPGRCRRDEDAAGGRRAGPLRDGSAFAGANRTVAVTGTGAIDGPSSRLTFSLARCSAGPPSSLSQLGGGSMQVISLEQNGDYVLYLQLGALASQLPGPASTGSSSTCRSSASRRASTSGSSCPAARSSRATSSRCWRPKAPRSATSARRRSTASPRRTTT